jgi:hypothetical protein
MSKPVVGPVGKSTDRVDTNTAFVASRKAAAQVAAARILELQPAPDGHVVYVSLHPEAALFDLWIDQDTKVMGTWDAQREHLLWRVPKDKAANLERGHHYTNGRIVRAIAED